MKALNIAGAVLLLFLGTLGCQQGASNSDLEEIKATQAAILEKLTAIETLAKAQPAARPGPPKEDYTKIHKINIANAPTLGNPNAPVALVEYSDFQCPFCSRVQPVLKEVLDKHPDKLKLVFKHFPLSFHRAARPAAIASFAAADQGKFWEMHDVLFANQKELTPDNMAEMAEKAGLDVARFNKDMAEKGDEYGKRVDADFAEGQKVDVRGTPSLYIGGKKVQSRSVEAMSAMVDEALKRSGS